jgi:hypothetical protein
VEELFKIIFYHLTAIIAGSVSLKSQSSSSKPDSEVSIEGANDIERKFLK